MIIACPSCNARYKVKDELIKEKGKKVKCKKCSAIFKAFRDQESVLLKAAPGQEDALKTQQVDTATAAAGIKVSVGAQAQAAPSQPTTDEPVTSQATVRVDRSKLQDYLKQAQDDQPPPPPPSLDAFKQDPEDDFPLGNLDHHGGDETVRVDPGSFAPTGAQDAGATMAVDRTQIDQFLKQQAGEDEDPLGSLAGEDDPPDAGATMAFDRSQIDAMMKSGQDEEEDLLGLGNDGDDAQNAGATMAVDRSQLDAFLHQNQAAENDPFATREAPPASDPLEEDEDFGSGDSGATMAMDRSQLDAFLKQNQASSAYETQETDSSDNAFDDDAFDDAPGDVGATMAVDRSQIDAFLQQNSAGEEPSDMLGFDNETGDSAGSDADEGFNDDGFNDDGFNDGAGSDAGATMAVDRSQIDAFLEQNQTPATPAIADDDSLTFDESPDSGPIDDEVGATVAMDRSQLDAFLSKAQETKATDADPFGNESAFDDADQDSAFADEPAFDTAGQDDDLLDDGPSFGDDQDDMLDDGPGFGDDQDDPFADEFPTNEATKTMAEPDVIDDAPVSEPDPLDVAAHQMDISDPFHAEITPPGFPSDDELGIADEAAGLDPHDGPVHTDPYATVVSDEPPDFNDIDPSDFGEDPPPPPPPSDTIPHLEAEQNALIQAEGALWQAWIDEEVYPDLTLETLERWVIEDRLLETDRLAPAGTEDFRRAEEVPEVAPFFAKYNKSGPSQAAAAPAKKGFFGWLKSLFKK